MLMRDILNTKAIASFWTTAHSNDIPFLGLSLFPRKKKAGLDLKWIRGHKGLPVSLKPSAFDTKSTFRDRIGVSLTKTQMAYFKESFLVSEEDEQDILRAVESNDPYLSAALQNIYSDAENLITSADVTAERMIWQLLTAENGIPSIAIVDNGASYEYTYGDEDFKKENFSELTGTDMWSDTTNAKPLDDIQKITDDARNLGTKLEYMVISNKTMMNLVNNAQIKSYVLAQNSTANIYMTRKVVNTVLEDFGIVPIVYEKKFKDEKGKTTAFVPDTTATFLPEGSLGNTWYGTSPIERTAMGSKDTDVSQVNVGVNIMRTQEHDPENTKITVDEIVLPSFEVMDSVFILKHSA